MLLNYEEALQNDQSLCEELFFLPSALHYYDNMFISAVVARAVFSTEKLLQNWDNSSFVEPRRQSLNLRENYFTHYVSVRQMQILEQAQPAYLDRALRCEVVAEIH